MLYVVYTIHVVTCLFLILVVLLQQGKGADLSVFGGGSTQAAFGARGAATLLHKMTVFGFVAFIFTTMAIGFLQKGGSGDSVMSTVTEGTATTVEPESEPATDAAPEGFGPTGDEAPVTTDTAASAAETGADDSSTTENENDSDQ